MRRQFHRRAVGNRNALSGGPDGRVPRHRIRDDPHRLRMRHRTGGQGVDRPPRLPGHRRGHQRQHARPGDRLRPVGPLPLLLAGNARYPGRARVRCRRGLLDLGPAALLHASQRHQASIDLCPRRKIIRREQLRRVPTNEGWVSDGIDVRRCSAPSSRWRAMACRSTKKSRPSCGARCSGRCSGGPASGGALRCAGVVADMQ